MVCGAKSARESERERGDDVLLFGRCFCFDEDENDDNDENDNDDYNYVLIPTMNEW